MFIGCSLTTKVNKNLYLGGEEMRCPYCNEEMELGFIQSRDGVTWNTKKCKVAALAS